MSVGRVRQSFIREGEKEYLERLRAAFPVQLVELGLDAPESMSPEEIKEREAVETLKKVQGYEYLIVLDERGKGVTSHDFAKLLSARMTAGTRSLCFLIGGAFGLSEKIRQQADYVLSLSALTMPHQLTRLVLLEQIYRAHTIVRGIKYHK